MNAVGCWVRSNKHNHNTKTPYARALLRQWSSVVACDQLPTHTHAHTLIRRCNVRMKVMTPRIRTHIYYRKRSNSYVVVEHALANISSAHLIETQTPSHTWMWIEIACDDRLHLTRWCPALWLTAHWRESVFAKTKLEIQSNCGTKLDSRTNGIILFWRCTVSPLFDLCINI